MNITEQVQNGVTIYQLEGRIDSEGAIRLEETLQAGMQAGKVKMILDMEHIQYVNSAALRTLAEVITHNRQHGGDLKLAALPPKVKRVLQIVGFDKFSSIHETVQAAIADFQNVR